MITTTPLQSEHLPGAAALFIYNLKQQRLAVPILPAHMEDPKRVAGMLLSRISQEKGLAAWDGDRLAGYLTWFEIDDFRDTGRKAAYVPEWGHAAGGDARRIHRALYRAAGEQWQAAGSQVHAITLLANDQAGCETWFWNGFGLGVVDAVRPMQEIAPARAKAVAPGGDLLTGNGLNICQAHPEDASMLAELEVEHRRHYSLSPTFMAPRHVESPEEIGAFLSTSPNSMWLAMDGEHPVGFLRFASASEGAAAIVESDVTVAIVGAYVRAAYRGRGCAPALLNAAIRHYHQQGFTCCAVDFESFNPEAADFWMRYFTPVCFSLMRVPENAY